MTNEELLAKIGKFAAPLVADPNISREDGIRIAAAFMVVVAEIFEAIGGTELAAQQFYDAADDLATGRK